MTFKTTAANRFEHLPDYPFSENYIAIGDNMKMHYVDEGNPEGEVVLLLHGEPSWSYLYRKMIPVLVEAGFRTIAPDLIGFGKSDKPTEQSDYTYAKHLEWTGNFIQKLNLQGINLFCQDWGGLLGLRFVAEMGERFSRVVTANTFLPTGDFPAGKAFLAWQKFSQTSPKFDVGRVLQNATVSTLSDEVIAAYNAPFPDDSYKAGARIFPSLVPTTPSDPETLPNRAALQQLKTWTKPFLTLFSDSDPITKGGDQFFRQMVPGTKGQPHETIVSAGHFLQEDKGEEIAEKMVTWIKSTS